MVKFMPQINNEQNTNEQAEKLDCELLKNILRIVTMLETALNRVGRKNYHSRHQYPEIYFEIENAIEILRSWIVHYQAYCGVSSFYGVSSLCLAEISQLIGQLILTCSTSNGKKKEKQSQRIQEREKLYKSINEMIAHIERYLSGTKSDETEMGIEFEKAILNSFKQCCTQLHGKKIVCVSQRGEKSYIFPWSDKIKYLMLADDRRWYRKEIVDKLGNNNAHATGHKPCCKGNRRYNMIGFRRIPRKVVTEGGKKEEFPIRMVQCVNCGEKFSLLPSFLPREKHFCIDIIGHVLQNILLFGQSIRGSLENIKIIGRELKSKQTIFNWLRWIGTLHPASILTRAGVTGSGYLQEDEGFETEPNLRTYTVFMVDPENLIVWHADYIDHVDEESLCDSFEKFVERITFKVLGVTKDKWKPSTDAIKSTFSRIWIGFCHRHCLIRFRHALSEYQKEVKCSSKEIAELYKKFKNVLETSTSNATLSVKVRALNDEAFKHHLLQKQLAKLKENGTQYTVNKRRKGITKTTSIVDNFLKIVKRKLKQVESFRNQECTGLLFRGMANIRNFVPFLSGAKNAHKSPFMLAQGETHGLPWIQVMNFHNSFLFTSDAF